MTGIQSIKRCWLFFLIISSFSCSNDVKTKTDESTTDSTIVGNQHSIDTTNAKADIKSDSLLFVAAFHQFRSALKSRNRDSLNSLVYFPLYGTAPFTGNYDNEEAGIDSLQLDKYADKIFDKDAKAVLNDKTFNALWMYDKTDFLQIFNDSSMMEKIWSHLDTGSQLGVVYVQYAFRDGKETNQSYLFGKINNRYRLVAVADRNSLQ